MSGSESKCSGVFRLARMNRRKAEDVSLIASAFCDFLASEDIGNANPNALF